VQLKRVLLSYLENWGEGSWTSAFPSLGYTTVSLHTSLNNNGEPTVRK